jgi:hypothetical protein
MQRLRLFKPDPIATLFLGLVLACGAVYTLLDLTPSSYGMVLTQIGAPEQGSLLGAARGIRSDEWAGSTALFQACVRNGFTRINKSSFYQEDLRNFYLLPLKDWSLIFKPEIWGFFVLPPATAFSLYYASLMCAFLIGYFLLFRFIGLDSLVAALAALLLYFCGFSQFWWTSFGSLTGGLPWVMLIVFAELRWWFKAILLSCVMPVMAFSFVYPALFIEFAFAGIILIAALQPSLFRSPRDLAAIAIGGLFTASMLYVYYQDIIPIMRNTWYPAKRVGVPGTVPMTAWLSQIFPFLSFSLRDYRHFTGDNICEIASVGSFLPILTLCLISGINRKLRNALIIVGAAFALITVWQVTPAPRWIGHLLLWDHAVAGRLLFISGFLLTFGCLLVWRDRLVSPDPLRIALFLLIGPIISVALKMTLFHLTVTTCLYDIALSVLAILIGAAACAAPASTRLPLLLGAITLINIAGFGRFNPIQSAEPIFNVPETDIVQRLRESETSTPEHYLVVPNYFGATLNGMGFRSVSHVLQAPGMAVFRKYFPQMDAARFDFVFNRYSNIHVTNDPFPRATENFVISVPIQAFEPVRNLRVVTLDTGSRKDCSLPRGGSVDLVETVGERLIVEGWAPWRGEAADQELHVVSARSPRAGKLMTLRRPDIAESKLDYTYSRAGFRLELSSSDGRPLRAADFVLNARGTADGDVLLGGCGCP